MHVSLLCILFREGSQILRLVFSCDSNRGVYSRRLGLPGLCSLGVGKDHDPFHCIKK